MNWLITGGCGFIGRALIRHLKNDASQRIRVFDNLSVGSLEDLAEEGEFVTLPIDDEALNWDANLSFVRGDILDAEALQKAVAGADIVIHLAANTGVGPSVEDPMGDCKTNVIGVLNMLEACRQEKTPRVVFASSGAPLGVQEPPLHEEMAAHPASPYGASKLAGEGYCSAYYHCFGVETVVLRFGNVYGEGSTKKASVVAKFIKQALAGETLEIYGDGTQTRDFIYIGDLIEAVYLAGTKKDIGGEVFQIATNKETTMSELTNTLVEAIEEVACVKANWINGVSRQGDVARNYSDTSKAKEKLGWQANTSLYEGLRKTVRFFV